MELVFDGSRQQIVGLRFNGVNIPQAASIQSAFVQFQADEEDIVGTDLTIHGEAVDHAETFTSAEENISGRPLTEESVSWPPLPWSTVGEADLDQRITGLAPVIEEIVKRPLWTSGNSLAIIISGTGQRTAESFDGDPAAAPLLHVEYSLPEFDDPAAAALRHVEHSLPESVAIPMLGGWSWLVLAGLILTVSALSVASLRRGR